MYTDDRTQAEALAIVLSQDSAFYDHVCSLEPQTLEELDEVIQAWMEEEYAECQVVDRLPLALSTVLSSALDHMKWELVALSLGIERYRNRKRGHDDL